MKVVCVKTGNATKSFSEHLTIGKVYKVLSRNESRIAKYYPKYYPGCNAFIIVSDIGSEIILHRDNFIPLRDHSLNILGI